MPTYVYKFIGTGETVEVRQSFHEESLRELEHPESGELLPVKKVFQPVGITFKGTGFFKTDNRGSSASTAPGSTSGSSSSSDSSSDTSSGSTSSSTSGSSSTSSGSSGSGSSSTSSD